MALVDIATARLRELTTPEGAVVMLNLYRLKTSEDGEKFRSSMAPLVGPILEELGAEIVYSGSYPASSQQNAANRSMVSVK